MLTNKPLLELNNISYRYKAYEILSNITFSIPAQNIVTVIGPNGAGKSTLCKVIMGVLKPTSGCIQYKTNLKISYMPQKLVLNPLIPITVYNFLTLTNSYSLNQKFLNKLLNEYNLDNIINKQLFSISGGEMQKVLFIKALLKDSDLLVLDEPTRGLDVIGQNDFYSTLSSIQKDTNKSILIISHDLYTVMKTSNQVICLNKHICCSGLPQFVKRNKSYQDMFKFNKNSMISPYNHQHK